MSAHVMSAKATPQCRVSPMASFDRSSCHTTKNASAKEVPFRRSEQTREKLSFMDDYCKKA